MANVNKANVNGTLYNITDAGAVRFDAAQNLTTAQQQQARNNIGAVSDDALAMIAPAYANLTFPVSAGQHCIYNSALYVAKQDIATSEAWTAAHWSAVTVGGEIVDLKSAFNSVTGVTKNIFDMHVFDGVTGITKDSNGYYTGTGESFKNAFDFAHGGVPGITFSANKQYYLSVVAYTDGNVSTSAVNGLQFSFYETGASAASNHIGRKSILNSTTTSTKAELFSTVDKSVGFMAIACSNSTLNVWHIKDIILCESTAAVDYVQHETAVDLVSRESIETTVHETDMTGNATAGGYINLSGKYVGGTVSLTPASSNSYRYALIDCSAGDAFVLTAKGASVAKPWAFVKEDSGDYIITDIFTSIPNSNDFSVTNTPVIAKESGKLIVNGTTANTLKILKITNSNQIVATNKAQFLDADIKSKQWYGKKIVCFGDSRTWYDKHSYTENCKTELIGKVCTGYQQQMRNLMMATVDSQGASGETSEEICTRIRAFDFTGYDAVLLEGGVNDFVKSSQVTIGEIQPIGSTFDTETVYGAWQSAIEYILTNYPSVLIYMDIPPIAWISANDTVFPYNTAKIKGEVAELYNIPCLDLYKNAGINVINRDYWYCDDVTSTNWRLHFNDYGNALIGAKIAEFMISR